MLEKQIKAEFKIKAQKDPDRYYPVRILREEGFERRQCTICKNYFWSVNDRQVCGEPDCIGGYAFIGDSPAKVKMDFIETWRKFSELFKEFGYTSIPRYPVVARWRDDADFVQASIYDFQPYSVTGEVDPPANPLVVPQFCLRFNDTDNVGITGRHYTGFVMIGQHAFEPPESYRPENYLEHIYLWLIKGMKIPKEELQFHEDAWAGGGNMGPSMEYFSRGLEIGNQVYIQYDISVGKIKELAIKVLDMGMGQERPAWFTYGTPTGYEVAFPTVVKKLYNRTGIKPDRPIMSKFLPYSGLLNMVDREKLDETWAWVSDKSGIEPEELKAQVLPLAGIYSLGDHTRSLLLALSDGALPSNVGGGYNLRVLVRRALDLISKYEWEISLPELCELHAAYLKPQYPELVEHLDEVTEILEVEERKYEETKKKSRRIVASLKGKKVSLEKLIQLYDSNGISPEMLIKEGLEIEVPADFYTRVSEKHEKIGQIAETHKLIELELEDLEKTEILYYNYKLTEFKAKVLKLVDRYVILNRTAFYPTSGGQIFDTGFIDGSRVVNVFKQGNVIVHEIEEPTFKEGDLVRGKVDWERRRQLAQHHTATHIINGAAREILGEHVWQAGAEKTLEKARLDITHYEALSDETRNKIEDKAKEVIAKNLTVESRIYKRDVAEAKFGFRLYQGGAVPGKELRVVKIGNLDVEACGGTHLKTTGEVENIRIIGSTKIQDGVVRLEYVAGEAARRYEEAKKKEWRKIMGTAAAVISEPEEWGFVVKEGWKILDEDQFTEMMEELEASAGIFSVPTHQLNGTLNKFLKEIKEDHKEINRIKKSLNLPIIPKEEVSGLLTLSKFSKLIFSRWKKQKKEIEKLKAELAKLRVEKLKDFEKIGQYEFLCAEIEADMDEAQKTIQELLGANKIVVLFGIAEKIAVVGACDKSIDIDIGRIVGKVCKILDGKGGGKRDFGRGVGVNKHRIKEAKELVEEYIREALD